ncbi:glycosyltransferase, partial [bacterium]|nr:glycosyltransferase [bacterium]
MIEEPCKIGVAIPCYNNLEVLKETIPLIYRDSYFIVVFDDNSTDGTDHWLKTKYPKINVLQGNGFNWWGGSITKAIDLCLKNDCDYILSLNADVCITPEVLERLIESSKKHSSAIVASLVVNILEPNKVVWAGSLFGKINNALPIYTSRYIKKAGVDLKKVGSNIYDVDEVHGRGVVFPKEVFKKIGNYDYRNFPHYGADTDFSFRAKSLGIRLIVDPKCVSKVFANNTGMRQDANNS